MLEKITEMYAYIFNEPIRISHIPLSQLTIHDLAILLLYFFGSISIGFFIWIIWSLFFEDKNVEEFY